MWGGGVKKGRPPYWLRPKRTGSLSTSFTEAHTLAVVKPRSGVKPHHAAFFSATAQHL